MQPPSGWYHAEGDPEDTVRWWDGSQWVGDPTGHPTEPAAPAGDPGPSTRVGDQSPSSNYSAASYMPMAFGGPETSPYSAGMIEFYYSADQLTTASRWRRFSGSLLEGLLIVLTLGIGWFIWWIFTAQDGQTPAKKLLGMYVMRSDGSRAGGGWMWFREAVIKGLVGNLLGGFTFYVYTILAPMWCLWDKDRQCLWDKMASTYVAHSPAGFKPLTANEFRLRGEQPPVMRSMSRPLGR